MLTHEINVLLLEDDQGYATLLAELISSHSDSKKIKSWVHHTTLKSALEYLEEHAVDVMLVDLGLPGAQGLEVFDRLNTQHPETAIVILTGADDDAWIQEAIQKGAQDYLVKTSTNAHTLIQSMAYALERKKVEKMKNDFITMASHELRTPMTVIQVGISNLKDSVVGTLNAEQMEVAKVIDNNAARLNKIVTNLLDISRLESGQIHPKPSPIDVEKLIEEATSGLKELVEKRRLSLHIRINANVPSPLLLDAELIIQVINNLTSNALRYASSEIVIEVKAVPEGVFFSVSNDGPILSGEDISKLFQKFSQIRRPQGGTGYKGTGLGLAICKEIIKKHNGRIWAQSAEDGLTSFLFVIPVVAPSS